MAKEMERKIVFEEPVMVGGKEVTELTMRRPKVGAMVEAHDLAGEGASSARIEANLFAVLCDVPVEDIFDWDLEGAYDKLQEAYTFLSQGGSRKGKTSGKQS